MEKVPGFVSALKTWLEARDDVDKVLPKGVTWSGISGGVLTIDVMCHTTKEAGTSSGAGALRTALFLEIGRAVQELG